MKILLKAKGFCLGNGIQDPDSTPWNGLFTLARAILKEAFRVRAIRPSIVL